MSSVAMIGSGNMGQPMTVNLVRAGHTVRGYDVFSGAREQATQAGLDVAGSATVSASSA